MESSPANLTPNTHNKMDKIIKGLEDSAYRKIQGLSATMLKTLQRSPYHLWDSLQNPSEPTPEMLFGTAVHTKLLEPHRFSEMFVESPKFDRRTTAGKEAAAKFEAENGGKHRLDPDDMAMLNAMVANVEETYGHIIATCEKEMSIVVDDPEFPIQLKGRFDLYDEKNGIIYDLKTCVDCSYNSFSRDVYKGSYQLQAFHYEFIALQAGLPVNKVVFIPTEKKSPYLCADYSLEFDPAYKHIWAERHKGYRKVWADAVMSGVYPKPAQMPSKSIVIR